VKLSLIFVFLSVFLFADSEYVKEHSHDLVKWHLWNEKTFEKAKKENKLILVTIGYSTCHWCHVMMKESFRNKEIAKFLNRYFIPIVVDKEEHPEIDRYYQWIYKKLYDKSPGWPINIIMTPKKEILFISNYIPPHDIFSRKGFSTLLPYFANLDKNQIKKITKAIKEKLKKEEKPLQTKNPLKIIEDEVKASFDFEYGGFKGLHKFPEYNKFKLLLDLYLLTKDRQYLDMLNLTLTNMAKSGMYDQIEGGFFRYSVDDDFAIPHFEKMLYTNALMIEIYALTYQYNPKKLYKKIINETINEFYEKYYDKKFKLFYAANSADSPNEGDYFCFSKAEILNALKNIKNKQEILNYINFEEEGNFEKDKNHIYFNLNIPPPKNLGIFLNNLKKLRKHHSFPFLDRKKILSWNAMMTAALFRASIIDRNYIKKAKKLLNSIYKNFYQNGIWYHSFVNKKEKKANLEDYAYLIRANIIAYEYTFDNKYLKNAEILIRKSLKFKDKIWKMTENFPATPDEKSYPSAVSVLFNTYIDFAALNNDFELYEFTKNELKKFPLKLEYAFLARVKLKSFYNVYVIKTSNPKLYFPIMYPFYLWEKTDYNYYQICDIYSCLKRSENFGEIDKFFKNIRY